MPKAKQVHRESQIDAFRQAARELECDESEEVFDRALSKIGKVTPEPKRTRRKRKPVKRAI